MEGGVLQTRVRLKPQRSCQNRKRMKRKQKLCVKLTVKWLSTQGVPKPEDMASKGGNSREIFENYCPETSKLKDSHKLKIQGA